MELVTRVGFDRAQIHHHSMGERTVRGRVNKKERATQTSAQVCSTNNIDNSSITTNKYLLLAECSVRTVSYGPRFFPSFYGPRREKNEDP